MAAKLTRDEVSQHNNDKDLWVVLYNKVYDLTTFADDHPGGASIIHKYAGKDGTKAFDPLHSKAILKTMLPKEAMVGEVDPLPAGTETEEPDEHAHAAPVEDPESYPPLERMLNLYDFEPVAEAKMTKEGWAYYSSGADDEITLRENKAAFQRIWLRPRVMVNVKDVDISTSVLGYKCSFPVYITATALGKLAHPEGEAVLTRAAGEQGIIQMCPTLASCDLEDMTRQRKPDQVQFYQLYVNANREITKNIVHNVEKEGCKALCVTCDAPQLGRREKDMRNKFKAVGTSVQRKGKMEFTRNQGTARAISSFIDPSLNWDDLPWLRSLSKMKLVLKGVQSGADAVKAAQHGCDAIIVSNHGGRQLDFARSGIEVLLEVTTALEKAGLRDKMEIWVDGGFRRGTDIFKALALGATCVGIGRPMLYSLAAYGQEGVEHAIQLLKDEFVMCMRLMGCRTVKDIRRDMVITDDISRHLVGQVTDNLTQATYRPLQPAWTRPSRL